MAVLNRPDIDYLHECFEADYKKGIILRRIRPREHFNTEAGWRIANANGAGKEAGTKGKDGKVKVWFGGRGGAPIPRAHILFAMYHGRWPRRISHINGDNSDDRIDNLEETTRSEIGLKRSLNKNNKTGFKGVMKIAGKLKTKFQGKKTVEGKVRKTLRYDTPAEAAEALKKI